MSLRDWLKDTFALRATDPIDLGAARWARARVPAAARQPAVHLVLADRRAAGEPAAMGARLAGWLALAIFWNVHQPRRVGMGAAFVFGLLMDVHEGALFGQHALAYTLVSYGAIMLHRRIQWFPLGAQALHVLPLLLIAQLASLLIRLWVGGEWPGWTFFAPSLIGAALWPLIAWLLLAPQRRPVDRDETRPL